MVPLTIADFREAARRRVPRFAFDFVDGGAGGEKGLDRNRAAFEQTLLMPRVLVNVDKRDMTARLFGRDWAAPFGVAPIGLANLLWPQTDERLAVAARDAGIPYILSTAGSTQLEEIARIAPDHAWFQLYVGADDAVVWDIVGRAERAGYEVLFVTVDVPAPGRRLRDIRNRFKLPLRPTPRLVWDLVRHPAWALATLRAGPPRFVNLEPYMPAGATTQSLAAFMASQISGRLDWELLARLRQRWTGRLVVKGVTNPDDARLARDMGADGIVVSNHGGRQLEAAPATLAMLPAVRSAVGKDFPVLLDSGVRSGEDIAKALALGADFVLLGRAMMYAAAAGHDGPARAIRILKDELDNTLAQTGRTHVGALAPDALVGSVAGTNALTTCDVCRPPEYERHGPAAVAE